MVNRLFMKVFTIVFLFFGLFASAQTADDFVFTIDVNSPISIRPQLAGILNLSVSWGDGQISNYSNPGGQTIPHFYSTAGVYTIIVSGDIRWFKIHTHGSNPILAEPINVTQWGTSQWQSMEEMFLGCQNLSITATDNLDLSNVANMDSMFEGALHFNSDISNLDVSNVTSMHSTFKNADSFNRPLESWDVSNVINMIEMFAGADSFNQPLNLWNVSNVNEMDYMFGGADSFNQPLNSWDTSGFYRFDNIFWFARSFNQDLSNWDFSFRSFTDVVSGSGLDTNNYDALLAHLLNSNFSPPSFFRARNLEYCDVSTRAALIQSGWNILYDSYTTTCSGTQFSGSVIYDIDNNGCDPSDIEMQNFSLNISDSMFEVDVFTVDGTYNVNLPDGTYAVMPSPINGYNIAPTSANITISNGVAVAQDFCLTAITPVKDLEVVILPLDDARPGFDTNYKIIYKNTGTSIVTGGLSLLYEADYMNLTISNPMVSSSTVNRLIWNFSNLEPFETREIDFSMNLNTPTDLNFPLNSDDTLNFNAVIGPTGGDITPQNNAFILEQTVVNSYDPNDKTCLQGETILPSEVGDYVHYRIRFENEGTASAITVRIVDYIDTTTHDISTLTPLSASHDYTTTITEGNKVEFLFDNINLPFTAPASQGYVLFKIKTINTLVLGDDFSNQAEIFFDFNFPIITNLETTSVAVPASVSDNDLFQVQLVPNPATNFVTISTNLDFRELTVYNTSGQVVLSHSLESTVLNHDLKLESLTAGLYFLEVSNGEQSAIIKLLKQ